MAFIEPMHRNKPNITYLLTCRSAWASWPEVEHIIWQGLSEICPEHDGDWTSASACLVSCIPDHHIGIFWVLATYLQDLGCGEGVQGTGPGANRQLTQRMGHPHNKQELCPLMLGIDILKAQGLAHNLLEMVLGTFVLENVFLESL